MIKLNVTGSFKNMEKFLNAAKTLRLDSVLTKYAEAGVQALASATPVDTGKTADSWGYKIKVNGGNYSITWTNSNVVNGVPIAIIIQYGHGTGTGGYVAGRDYINPAIQPIMDKLADDLWKEVANL